VVEASNTKSVQQTQNELRALYAQSNLPRPYWNTRLIDLGAIGTLLREYVLSAQRVDDILDGRGYWISGGANERVPLFASFARDLIIHKDGVYFCSLVRIHDALQKPENNPDLGNILAKCKALFITHFQQEGPFPYNGYMRARIETMLQARMDDGLRNYYSSEYGIQDARQPGEHWWTSDFLVTAAQTSREFAV
jgi:hypothetical protein